MLGQALAQGISVASARLLAPIFSYKCVMCRSTVGMLMTSVPAISLVDLPAAIRRRTSPSRSKARWVRWRRPPRRSIDLHLANAFDQRNHTQFFGS